MKNRKTMLNKGVAAIVLLLCGLFVACSGNGTQGNGLTSSTGRSSEMLVVCPTAAWNGTLGDTLRSVLLAPVPSLPQTEPMFRVSQVNAASFNAVYQKFRNILILQTDSTLPEPVMSVARDRWATPQIVITLRAANREALCAAFSEQRDVVVDYIMQAEMKRFQRAQRAQQDNYIVRQMEERYRMSMVFPEGFVFAVSEPDFCWLRKETKYWGQHVMVYREPYTDKSQFSKDYICQLRNRYTREHVQGTTDSSYILIDDRFYPVEQEVCAFPNASYAVKTSGLWGLFSSSDRMGGPFVSFTFLDSLHQQVVCVDGFLYAPSDEKRDLLRQVEAILLSVRCME